MSLTDCPSGTMETGPALVRAILAMSKSKPDLINMSYGEPSARANAGRVMDLANQLVELHGVTFVSSAGNNGPAYTTTVRSDYMSMQRHINVVNRVPLVAMRAT